MKTKRNYLILFSALILFLTACNNVGDETLEGEQDIPSEIREESTLEPIHEPYLMGLHEPAVIGDKLELPVLTGEWFMHNGEGQLGYGVTNGFIDEGDELVVTFFSHEGPVEITDRVRISKYEINSNGELVLINEVTYDELVIDGETMIHTETIEGDQAVCLLFVEMLDGGDVTDRLIQPLFNLELGVNVSMEMDEVNEDRFDLRVINHGSAPLTLGMHYYFDEYQDGEWERVPLDMMFIEIAIMLGEGEVHEQEVDVSELDSGRYRVVKSILSDSDERRFELAKEFEI